MSNLTSNNMRMLEKSMDFLWAKESTHMENIANAETPGYKVKTVRFEEAFDKKLRETELKLSKPTVVKKHPGPRRAYRQVIENADWTVDEDDEITRMDENGVNATEQMLEIARTAYQLQYVYRTYTSDLKTLNTAITG